MLAVLFVRRERRAPEPVLPLTLFANPVLRTAAGINFTSGLLLWCGIFFVPLFAQEVRGVSPTRSGLVLVPLMFGAAFGTLVTGRLVARTGRYRAWPIIGSVLMAVAVALLVSLGQGSTVLAAALSALLLGTGAGFVMQPSLLAAQNGVEPRELGTATSTALLFRTLGNTVGIPDLRRDRQRRPGRHGPRERPTWPTPCTPSSSSPSSSASCPPPSRCASPSVRSASTPPTSEPRRSIEVVVTVTSGWRENAFYCRLTTRPPRGARGDDCHGHRRRRRALHDHLGRLPRGRQPRRLPRVPRPGLPRGLRRLAGASTRTRTRTSATTGGCATGTTRCATRQQEADGIVGEVVFPNTVPPFFPSFVLFAKPPTDEEYQHRHAGVQAHNRWLVDWCDEFPERRAGVGQIFLNDIDDAIADATGSRSTACAAASSCRTSPPT